MSEFPQTWWHYDWRYQQITPVTVVAELKMRIKIKHQSGIDSWTMKKGFYRTWNECRRKLLSKAKADHRRVSFDLMEINSNIALIESMEPPK